MTSQWESVEKMEHRDQRSRQQEREAEWKKKRDDDEADAEWDKMIEEGFAREKARKDQGLPDLATMPTFDEKWEPDNDRK